MSLEIILDKSKAGNLQTKIVPSALSKDQLLTRFKTADEDEEHSDLIFYKNSIAGIKQIISEVDMAPSVVEFFDRYYEIKH